MVEGLDSEDLHWKAAVVQFGLQLDGCPHLLETPEPPLTSAGIVVPSEPDEAGWELKLLSKGKDSVCTFEGLELKL